MKRQKSVKYCNGTLFVSFAAGRCTGGGKTNEGTTATNGESKKQRKAD